MKISKYKIFLKILEVTELFFKQNKYLKLDLPVLSPSLIPESYLEVFETEYKYFRQRKKLYLTPSPELFIKRLLSQGIGDCYYLGKAFRNSEPISQLHLPEFTMLEFYKVGKDYTFMMKEIHRLFLFISQKVFHKSKITYQKYNLDLAKPWEEITISQAFYNYCQIDKKTLFNPLLFKKAAAKKGYSVNNASYLDLFSQIYTQEIEPHLGTDGKPTIIYDYPAFVAALAKLNKDGKTAQRFEFYMAGIELGDCYTELTNWKEQEDRFKKEQIKRIKDKKIKHPIDQKFLMAIKKGLPACTGIAIGFDRLAMIFSNALEIKELKLINNL